MLATTLFITVVAIVIVLLLGVVWSWTRLLFMPIEEALAARHRRETHDVDQYLRDLDLMEKESDTKDAKR